MNDVVTLPTDWLKRARARGRVAPGKYAVKVKSMEFISDNMVKGEFAIQDDSPYFGWTLHDRFRMDDDKSSNKFYKLLEVLGLDGKAKQAQLPDLPGKTLRVMVGHNEDSNGRVWVNIDAYMPYKT